MVGGSHKIYKGIVDLCVSKYRESEGLYVGLKETAYCSLRSQLLMALHDAGANELCSKVGPCPFLCCRSLVFVDCMHACVDTMTHVGVREKLDFQANMSFHVHDLDINLTCIHCVCCSLCIHAKSLQTMKSRSQNKLPKQCTCVRR